MKSAPRRKGSAMHSWPPRTLVVAAAMAFMSAALVEFAVIPLVRGDTFPHATPEAALPALRSVVFFGVLLVAASLLATGLEASHARLGRVLSGIFGLLCILVGLLLIDAAAAYSGHGPGMRGAAIALGLSAFLEVAAGASMVGSKFMRCVRRGDDDATVDGVAVPP